VFQKPSCWTELPVGNSLVELRKLNSKTTKGNLKNYRQKAFNDLKNHGNALSIMSDVF